MRTIGKALVLSKAVSSVTGLSVAQTSVVTNADLRFAAASVKPVAWEPNQFHGGSCHGIDSQYRQEISTRPVPLGRCVFQNAALGLLIRFAYQGRERPALIISSGDKWIWSEAFEVQATAEHAAETVEEQLRLMLQALLHERFKLQFHDEMHEERGFALMRAGNGRSLRTSKGSQEGPIYIRRDGAQFIVTGEQVTMESLINFLSGNLQHPIQDETMLDRVYDVELHFTPTDANANTTNTGLADPSGPSLFTALQEQLGLQLQRRRVPVEVFVIEHAERPSRN